MVVLLGHLLALCLGFEKNVGPIILDFATPILIATPWGELNTTVSANGVVEVSRVVLEVPAVVTLVSSGLCGWLQGLDLGIEVTFHCLHLCHNLLQSNGFYSICCGWC